MSAPHVMTLYIT